MVDRVVGDKALPEEVSARIVAKADGVPLFVEELTKAVLESGLLRDAGDRYELTGPLPPLAIPATLHDSLMARLDRLAPVKEVAQIGAALGREFSYALLVAVAARPEPELRAALDQLVASELVFRRGTPPEATYSFKHALVQDAAYDTLLKSRRQQLHARIAEVIESRFPGIAEAQPEVMAQHLEAAGLLTRAVRYRMSAGEHATRRSANLEAIVHLSRGLEMVAALPENERLRWELRLRVALCPPLVVLKGYGAPETAAAFAAAKDLAEQTGDSSFLMPLLYDEFFVTTMRADYRHAQEVGERFLALAEAASDPGPMMIARRALGVICFGRGALGDSRANLEASVSLYDPTCHLPLTFQYGLVNPRVAALAFLARTVHLCGYPERACELVVEATALARELGHMNSLAFALIYGAVLLYHTANDRHGVATGLQELRTLTEAGGQPMWRAYADVFEGWALAQEGRRVEGLACVEAGMRDLTASASRYQRSQMLGLLAQVQILTGAHVSAAGTLNAALDFVADSDERYFEAELWRLRASCGLFNGGTFESTLADLRRSLDLARAQGARAWELRSSVSLSGILAEQGRRAEAYDLLAPVYGWFTEGFDTADLKEAKALLHELR
jgi:predicted ATPase